MLKKITFKKIVFVLLFLLIVSQFFQIDKTNPPLNKTKDLLVMSNAGAEITSIIRTSCYDCHSNEVAYPWYTNIAPVSWWIKHHINEGRRHLNFSEWGNYSSRKADHKLEECVENVEEEEMPMSSYTWMHGNANLTSDQKNALVSWFKSLRTGESEQPESH